MDNEKARIVETLKEVSITGKTYAEYIDALADHLIAKGTNIPPCSEEVKSND